MQNLFLLDSYTVCVGCVLFDIVTVEQMGHCAKNQSTEAFNFLKLYNHCNYV